MTPIEEIQNWYIARCDGDWEHNFGVKIDTLDNPGWIVRIDLTETQWEEIEFEEIAYGMGAETEEGCDDWLHCRKSENQFVGCGGPRKLEEILKAFSGWIHSKPNK